MTLFQRAWRKAHHLFESRVVERLFAEGIAPALYPRLYHRRDRSPPNPAAVRTVLVWNIDSLGDFLFTTPALRALRAGYPSAAITLVANRACRDVIETNPNIDRSILVDPTPFYTGRGLLRGIPELAGSRFDVMLVLEMGSRPADAGRVFGRRLDVGYLVSSDLGILKTLPDRTLPSNRDMYWPAYFLKAVEHLGLAAGPPALEVVTTAADDASAAAVLPDEPGVRDVGLHPFVAPYAMLTKKWPDDSFVELARLLASREPTRFVLSGSSDDAAACEMLARRIASATGAAVVTAAGRLSPRGSAALFRRLAILVTGDTAALHLAAASGTPVVALFGATDPRLLAPPGAVVLTRPLPCRPCFTYRDRRPGWPICLFDHPKCLHEITPAAVADAVGRATRRARAGAGT